MKRMITALAATTALAAGPAFADHHMSKDKMDKSGKHSEMMMKSAALVSPNIYGDTIVEYNSRAHKMPWIYKCGKTGKQYKTTSNNAYERFAS